jgi:hypothetical protein
MKLVDSAVPFVSNTPEDKQCLQASYAMIRQHFEPELRIEWDDWADITGFVPGKGTWSMAGLMWFQDNGYEVVHIADFDYADFALRGPEYLVETLDEEVANWNIKYTDFHIEQGRARRFLASGIWVKRHARIQDVRSYLEEGFLIKCSVNLNKLNGKQGYLSHAVVVKGITDAEVILHDPGLPAYPNRHVSFELFQEAWKELGVPGSEKMDAIRKINITSPVTPSHNNITITSFRAKASIR